jgi:hypothetical protein
MSPLKLVWTFTLLSMALAVPSQAEARCLPSGVGGDPRDELSAPPPPPPAPGHLGPQRCQPRAKEAPRIPRRGLLQFGLQGEAVYFRDGALAGPGVFAQARIRGGMYLHVAMSLLTACSRCIDVDLSRTDMALNIGAQYFLLDLRGLGLYLRGSLTYRIALFTARHEAKSATLPVAHLLGVETGLGLDWRIGSWVILGVDAAYLCLGRVSSGRRANPAHLPPGLASVHKTNHGASVRLNLGVRF